MTIPSDRTAFLRKLITDYGNACSAYGAAKTGDESSLIEQTMGRMHHAEGKLMRYIKLLHSEARNTMQNAVGEMQNVQTKFATSLRGIDAMKYELALEGLKAAIDMLDIELQ